MKTAKKHSALLVFIVLFLTALAFRTKQTFEDYQNAEAPVETFNYR